MKAAPALLLCVACWAASIGVLSRWETFEGQTEFMSVLPSMTARGLAAGFENLLADGLYVNFVIYFGKHLRRDKAYHNVHPVLDLITDLDPRFEGAYAMGALALGDNGDVDASEALWNKGVAANPNNWSMAYQAGMNLFLFATKPDQYDRAAKLFGKAAALPGATPTARFMQGRCYDVGQRKDLAAMVWRKTYLKAASAEERTVAERSLKRLGVPLPDVSLPVHL
jgi:tetratricopeptide (TPR) repeat protein